MRSMQFLGEWCEERPDAVRPRLRRLRSSLIGCPVLPLLPPRWPDNFERLLPESEFDAAPGGSMQNKTITVSPGRCWVIRRKASCAVLVIVTLSASRSRQRSQQGPNHLKRNATLLTQAAHMSYMIASHRGRPHPHRTAAASSRMISLGYPSTEPNSCFTLTSGQHKGAWGAKQWGPYTSRERLSHRTSTVLRYLCRERQYEHSGSPGLPAKVLICSRTTSMPRASDGVHQMHSSPASWTCIAPCTSATGWGTCGHKPESTTGILQVQWNRRPRPRALSLQGPWSCPCQGGRATTCRIPGTPKRLSPRTVAAAEHVRQRPLGHHPLDVLYTSSRYQSVVCQRC